MRWQGDGADQQPPAMGPLPAAAGCDCRICRPDDTYDEGERRCIEVVLRHGWQVTVVFAGDEPDEPAFAYTIGLPHRVGHPELVISGLDQDLMYRVLNDVGQRVMDGQRLVPGDLLEGVLAHVPVLVEAVADDWLPETVSWSGWFHRRRVTALQLVWPDTSGRFAWQPGSSAAVDELQPPSWRVTTPRVGAVAADPPWPLPVPPDLLTFSCVHVVEEGLPVCFVARESHEDRGEDWTFHCVSDHGAGSEQIRLLHAAHVVRSAPSVREVADLALGEQARRPSHTAPWERSSGG